MATINFLGDTILSIHSYKNVHIRVHFANGSMFLDGPGDAIVLDCLMCQLETKFCWKKQLDSHLLLRQNARILRRDTTFAEVQVAPNFSILCFFIKSLRVIICFAGRFGRRHLSSFFIYDLWRSLVLILLSS